MWNKLVVAAIALAGAQGASAAETRTIAVANADFEKVQMDDGTWTENRVADWFSYGGIASSGTMNPRVSEIPAVPSGNNIAYVNSFQLGDISQGGFFQDTAEAIRAGTLYTLSVQVLRRVDEASYGPIRLGRFAVQLLSGNDVLASGTYTDADIAPGGVRTLDVSYLGTAGIAGPLRINFRSFYDGAQEGLIRQAGFDDVRLTAQDAAVPEPAGWAMMVGGVGLVGGAARRRRATMALA